MRKIVKAIDIQEYFGKSESMSFKLLREIKKYYQKQPHQPVTIADFCEYYNVNRDDVEATIVANEQKRKQIQMAREAEKQQEKIVEQTVANNPSPAPVNKTPHKGHEPYQFTRLSLT